MTDACKSITVMYRVHVHHVTSTEKETPTHLQEGRVKWRSLGSSFEPKNAPDQWASRVRISGVVWWKGVQTEQRDSRQTAAEKAETGLDGEGRANSEKSA